MAIPKTFKLEKLKIEAFDDVQRLSSAKRTFIAPFNPTSYSQHYGISWSKKKGIQTSGYQGRFIRTEPARLQFDLLLDGTGVTNIGLLSPLQKSVPEQVDLLRRTAYTYNGEIHRPNYLVVSWGRLWFSCQLKSLDFKYELFDRDGMPLRATASVIFIADEDDQKRNLKKNNSSPDLTHSRTVRAGDTLPGLTYQIYGSAAPYRRVARFNGLDHFRFLEAGRELQFPPRDALPPAVGVEAEENP